MKANFLLSLILVSCSFTICNAQIKKGTISLGGDLSFYTNSSSTQGSSDNSKQNNLNLSPSIGKAVKDNLVFGIDLSYVHSFSKSENNIVKNSGNSFNAGVFLRKYLTLGKGFYLFGQGTAEVGYGTAKTSYQNSSMYKSETKSFGTALAFYPGASYAISKKFQVEAGFRNLVYAGYSHSEQETTQAPNSTTTKSKGNSFQIGTTANSITSFTMGFRVFFPG